MRHSIGWECRPWSEQSTPGLFIGNIGEFKPGRIRMIWCAFDRRTMTADTQDNLVLQTYDSHGIPFLRRLPMVAQYLLAPIVVVVGLLAWEAIVRWRGYPPFILPGPAFGLDEFLAVAGDGTLARHTAVTLVEIALGLTIGLSLALVSGYILGKNQTAERILSPYIVASQSVPIVAIAPLLIIWFGSGSDQQSTRRGADHLLPDAGQHDRWHPQR